MPPVEEKPKHLGAGLRMGLGSAATGIAAGVGMAVAAPVAGAAAGAKKAGVAGAVAGGVGGALAGIAGLAIAPIYGIGRGAYVAAQGLVETPGYIKGAQRCSHSNQQPGTASSQRALTPRSGC